MSSLRSLLGVLVPVAALVLTLEAALAAVPLEVLRFPPSFPASQRQRYVSTRVPGAGAWVLVMGGSSAEDAFDLSALGLPARALTQGFGYPSDLALSLAWSLRRLPPDRMPALVVWGLNRVSLLDRGPSGEGDACDTLVATRAYLPDVGEELGLCPDEGTLATRLERAARRRSPWIGGRDLVADRLVVACRTLLFGGDGLAAHGPQRFRSVRTRTQVPLLRANIGAWLLMGVFEDGPFDPRQVRAVQLVSRECERRGVPLVLVSMPEHSRSRRRYAEGVRGKFDAFLAAQGRPVLDLYTLLEDGSFMDQGHANVAGREIATAALAADVQSRLAGGEAR